MVEKKNTDAEHGKNDIAEWSFVIGHVPEMPKIKFLEPISWLSLSRILAAMNIAVQTPDVNMADADVACPEEITLGNMVTGTDGAPRDVSNHEATRALCERLAMMGISHHGYFEVGGIWMIQSVEFNNPRASNGIICWPAGMSFSAADAAYIILGESVKGKQHILDRIYAAGGYVSVDLELLGVRGGIVPNVSCGTKPEFARYNAQYRAEPNLSYADFNLTAFSHTLQPHNATQH